MNDYHYDLAGKRVWVAGHTGMVGSAVVRRLQREPIGAVVTAEHSDLDLRRQAETEEFVAEARPDVIVLAAARVGGLAAHSTAQADFLYDNLMIAANVIEAARTNGVERMAVFGSAAVYPRGVPQPMNESALLSGPPEPTHEGDATAKIAAIELLKMYRREHGMSGFALMPTNLYGPNDNYNPATSHVLPALLRKVHEAKLQGATEVPIWGSGTPRREFLFVDDLADAVVFTLATYDGESPLNVGTGVDVTIRHLADVIADVVGWDGEFVYDTSKPDGTPRMRLDVSRIENLGWRARTDLRAGIEATYAGLDGFGD
ncbi:MAG: GDP-L-fucose synthase [Acidimicrobiia bacterium]